MSARIRLFLLAGCVLVAGLEAPLTGRALRTGLAGPYRAEVRESLVDHAPAVRALDVAAVFAEDLAHIGAPATIVPRRAAQRTAP